MELDLKFCQGVMQGEGRDMIGHFMIRGTYTLNDGKCAWTKHYTGKHDVFYKGYNEGKGIWGLWEIPPSSRGGFHIWPTAMGDPTTPKLAEAMEEPTELIANGDVQMVDAAEPMPVGTNSHRQAVHEPELRTSPTTAR
jgi:hypothetical protein